VDEEGNISGLVFGVIFAIVIIMISAFLMLFYCKRNYQQKKTELAHVHYIANSETGHENHIYALPEIKRRQGSNYNLVPEEDPQSFQNPMYATFQNSSPTNSTRRLTSSPGQNLIVKQNMFQQAPKIVLPDAEDYSLPYNKNVYSAIDELKETTFDEDNIYEELKKKRTMETDRISDESYDRLDFTRPIQDLKPHYQSTDTIRSRSRNSSHLSREGQDEISNNSFESNKSETDFCKEVLTSVENLNASTTRTRKTIYEPEVDSGISSNRSTTTNPWSPATERSGIM